MNSSSRSTTKKTHEEIQVWDNSNIAESYSGVVLPLTCSFAKFIYAQVYRDVARTSNIDTKKIEENAEVFDNLLGFFYGRFYYNILNWYKMLTLFPGYDRNKKNLDMMISARSKAELNQSYQHNVHLKDKISYYSHILLRLFRFEKDLRIFKNHVKSYLVHVRKQEFEKASLDDLWKWFEDFQEKLLRKWSLTIDNDFMAMTWFGLYRRYASKNRLNDGQIISQITAMQSVISAQQINALENLAEIFHKNDEFMRMAKNKKWKECYKQMMENQDIGDNIQNYLDVYGGRFANELKLEAKDLESDPSYLPQILYAYKANRGRKLQNEESINLAKHKKVILIFLSKKTKHYLRNREELRLFRSQTFSYTRKLFIAMGKRLKDKDIINNYNDIFYLELQEIEQLIKGKAQIEVKNTINKRKKDYKGYQKIKLDNVLITRGNELPRPKEQKQQEKSEILRGTGCSLGCVSGKITIMNEFKLPEKPLEIIVVKHTDPGWTPLFGLCRGLIVENGGILSHAAIISRELNLPCVIGVKNATSLLKNGQNVIIDGSKGTIKIEE